MVRDDSLVGPIQKKILSALLIALRPLARAMLNSGLGYREFSDTAKRAFVEVASTDYGIRGRRTNNSRIAVITGISRKEVKRLLEVDSASVKESLRGESPISVVLHHWHNDPAFLDANGRPAMLPFSGAGTSFEQLVRKCIGDIPAGAMRKELVRVGAATEAGRLLKAVQPYFVPPETSDRLCLGLEEGAATLLTTIAHNADPNSVDLPLFQRVASVDGISDDFIAEIQATTTEKLTNFGLDYCAYLDHYQRESAQLGKAVTKQIGIGLYYYSIDLEE